MQNTPNRAIPYYEATDPADLAYITQAMATRLDAILVRRVWHQSYIGTSKTNGQTVVTFTPGTLPPGRLMIHATGQSGFSSSATQRIGLTIASNVGTAASAQTSPNQPPIHPLPGEYYPMSWAGYVDLPAGGSPTVTLNCHQPTGGNAYYFGEIVATFLQLGEY